MQCSFCQSTALLECSACSSAYYCGKACQSSHFEEHEPVCIEKRMSRGAKRGKVMKEFKQGRLHSGSKHGPIVKDKKQAWAIAYAEAERMKKGKK